MENMEAVNIRLPAPACTSACTSCRMTVNLELPASELIISMQLPWKFWPAEVSAQTIFALFRKHTRISFFSPIRLTRPSPKEQRKVWFVHGLSLLVLCYMIMFIIFITDNNKEMQLLSSIACCWLWPKNPHLQILVIHLLMYKIQQTCCYWKIIHDQHKVMSECS